MQARSSKLKVKMELFLIILSALSFQPKLQRAAHLIQEIVQEKTERE